MFQQYGLAYDPEIEISQKMDDFSSNTVWLMTPEQILDEFSRKI